MGPREGPRVFARIREKITELFFYLDRIFYIYLNKQTNMSRTNDYIKLKREIISLSNTLIQEGTVEGNYEKWFVGNSLGTIILAAENGDDMKKLADFFYEYCERKRKEYEIAEAEDIQKLAIKIDNMPTREFKGLNDLLDEAGICLS